MAEAKASRHSVRLRDGLELSYLLWRPPGDPRIGSIFLHGYGEHGERFLELGRTLTRMGHFFVAPDIRGHGRSGGRRGHVERFDDYLDDLDALFLQLRAQTEVRDWVILGHSHGALISLRYALRHAQLFRGIVLCNPLLALNLKVPGFKAAIGRVTSSVWPTLAMYNEIDRGLVSHDPAIEASYRKDPLVHHQATARWYAEMLTAANATLHEAPEALKIPLLLLLSTEDHIVDPSVSQALFHSLKVSRKTLKIYEGCYHELFNELNRDQVMGDLGEWLEQELATTLNKS